MSTRVRVVFCVIAALAAACSQKLDGPKPSLAAPSASVHPIDPGIVCADQLTTELTVHGKNFSPVPIDIPHAPKTALPSLLLSRGHALNGDAVAKPDELRFGGEPGTKPSNAFDGDEPLLRWSSQEELSFTVNQRLAMADGTSGTLAEGVYDVTVINPDHAKATAPASLAVVARPKLDALQPTLTCLAQGARTLQLTGSGFLHLGDALPQLEAGGVSKLFDLTLDDCSAIAHKGLDAELCSAASIELAEAALAPGAYALTLHNPETAACHSEEDVKLRVVPAPVIDAVEPSPVCVEDVKLSLVVRGSGFLEVDDAKPAVEIDGQATEVMSLGECETLETSGHSVRSCKTLDLGKIVADVGAGAHDVSVENPMPAGCSVKATKALRILPPPTVKSLVSDEICGSAMQKIVILGKDFVDGAVVRVDSVAADTVKVIDDTRIEATFTEGLAPGVHDVTVQTGMQGCASTLAHALTVDPAPLVFFVDPPVAFNEVAIDVTVFTSGLTAGAALDTIELIGPESSAKPKTTTLTVVANPKPNRIVAHVPGLDGGGDPTFAPGKYTVRVTNKLGCGGELPAGLTLTDQTNDALLASIAPSFVAPDAPTAVTITGSGFTSLPRVYITPAGGTGTAVALRAVELQSGTKLTAIVPGDAASALATGVYDVLLVSASGEVDVLANGLTIVASPPVIERVVGASIVDNAATTVTVSGSAFDVDTVVLDCKLPASNTHVSVSGTVQGSPTATSVQVQLDPRTGTPSAASAGSVCVVRLTNQDGSFSEYSALSITNSSFNLAPWVDATDMTMGRRALSLAAGRPTATSRFLYAIGGDNGVMNSATDIGSSVFDSVESASVDVFGAMSAWSVQRNTLPAPRTWAGATRIGRFLYLVGGHDGTSATSTLLRAQVLDPLVGPEIEDIDAALGDGKKGLGGGLWFYRVSATYPANDASNPGGESLAGELLPLQLPERDEKIQLTLSWAQVAGADGYRVYRSASADGDANALELIGSVSGGTTLSFVDEGAAAMSGKTPLPAGSLGKWHAVDGARCNDADCALGTAREALATVSLADPNDATQYFLYAFGGRDASGTYLDTYEVATVHVAADGSQTVDDWAIGSDTLSSPRAELGVWVLSAENSATIRNSGTPGDVWVFAGGGRTSGVAFDHGLEAGLLQADGTLGTFSATDPVSGNIAGFGSGASNSQLYTFGGIAGTADGTSAQLCAGGGGCAALPDLKPGAFNALGAATTQRIYTGSTQESAFFFLAGGHDGTNTLATTEQTVQ